MYIFNILLTCLLFLNIDDSVQLTLYLFNNWYKLSFVTLRGLYYVI